MKIVLRFNFARQSDRELNFLPVFSGGILFLTGLLRNKIQKKENIIKYFQFSVSGMKTGKISSDGSHVNVGYFDSDGLNVNNNWDDNRNSNIGLASARTSSSVKTETLSS